MNKYNQNAVQFDYFSSNYDQFERDFYRFSNVNIPLTFLVDDILQLMLSNKITYFRLNGRNSKDKRDHYFLFEACGHQDNDKVVIYKYLGHTYQLKQKKPISAHH